MNYRLLGKSGLRVSEFCLGTMHGLRRDARQDCRLSPLTTRIVVTIRDDGDFVFDSVYEVLPSLTS